MKSEKYEIRPKWRENYDKKVLPVDFPFDTVSSYGMNFCDVHHFLAIGGVLIPRLFEAQDRVFRVNFFETFPIPPEVKSAGKASEEAWANLFQLGDALIGSSIMEVDKEFESNPDGPDLVLEIFKVLAYNWNAVLAMEFPGRKFVFEVGMNMFGEECLGMTFWQERHGRPDFGEQYVVEKAHPVWE